MIRPRGLLWIAVAAFGAGMSALAVLQQRAFATGRFDVGNLTQAVWSTAHGHFLEVTDLQGREISRLGAHFDPIAAALAPLWWVWPDPSLLLVVQAVAVALGAVPVFLLARRHLHSDWAGLGFALVYLLYPPTQWLVVDDFHPVAFATPLLLGAIWFLTAERMLPFALCAGAACLTKEQVGLVVAMLGIWHAAARAPPRRTRHRRGRGGRGGRRHRDHRAEIRARRRLALREPVRSGRRLSDRNREDLVEHPLRVLGQAFSHRDLVYLRDLLLPLGGLPLLSPLVALTALPELVLNLLSSTRTQTSIHFHYTAAAIPAFVAGAVLGAARLQRARPSAFPAVARSAVAVALVSGVLLGPLPVWRHVPFGSKLATRDHIVTAHARVAARAVQTVPAGAPVSATNALGAHLSERRRIFSFPVLQEARWVAVDTTRPSYLDASSNPDRFAAALTRLRADRRWRVVFAEDGILVLHRA